MYLDRISPANPETFLITRDALARQQWEAVCATIDAVSGQRAWPSRAFRSRSQWLAERFDAAQAAIDHPSLILSPGQTERLWRRVIESSPAGPALIGSGGVARWARSARRSLLEHGLAPADQSGAVWGADAGVFLDWNRDFEAALASNDWVDPDSLLYRINRLPVELVGHDLTLLDPPRDTPEVRRLIDRWHAARHRIDRIEPDDQAARVAGLIAADPTAEIRLAARWATERLRERPDCRLAVVIPDLTARRDAVEAIFADHLGSARVTAGGSRALGEIAVFGAALTAIRLLGPGAGFAVLSRWLRSPFFSSQDAARARHTAGLEIALRSDPRAQRDFAGAWRHLGLASRFAKTLPDTATRLDRALERLPQRATPTSWTAVWQSCLRILGWHGPDLSLPSNLQNAWDNAWARFSELTAILGAIDQGAAFDVLGEIVATESIYQPMGLEGVVLLTRIDQVGPGFAGAWIAGFSDEGVTSPDSANPLLPRALQARLGIAGATPESALAASIDDLKRLERRVPEATFSCPLRIGDEPRLPSPLIADWQPAAAGALAVQGGAGQAAARIGARAWQQPADPAPALDGAAIRGGIRTLNLQSACPARAFCVARLKAEPIEPPARGIDSRLRGRLIHRVLELLLDPQPADPAKRHPGTAIEQAFASLTRRGDAAWEAQLRSERRRIERIIGRFLEAEAGRPEFTTQAVERRAEIPIDGRTLSCRLDRIDRLASGETLLIDYKTGRSPRVRWFDARLGDCQLPAYALEANADGIAAIRLDDSDIVYRWAGRVPLSLPGRGQTFDDADWQAQIVRWREQISQLLDEFAHGDVRVPGDAAERVAADDRDQAGGAFAPLTRVGDLR